jgi:adenine-specific DNA-methyltransferase
MQLKPLTPNQSLNKAYRKEKVGRADIELFKQNLNTFLASINPKESEEHVKNNITEFLKLTYYQGKNQINTKGRIDLAIYDDKKIVVAFEAKRPDSPDMVTKTDLNRKALQELILYYFRERIDENNTDIKYLIATDMYQWFLFDAVLFDRTFYQNNQLAKDYIDWRDGRKADTTTDFFYSSIASPFLANLQEELSFTWFDLRDFAQISANADTKDDARLVPLYKLLSPAHLLKQPFANDSNTLDTRFYSELLHIIGLEETKDGGKKLIRRKKEPDPGSLLENTINILSAEDRLHRLSRAGADFGENKEDRLFNIALELCITWINRILFLKLLEGQLLNYHSGNENYRFLDFKTIPNYDELNKLFFQVLARRHPERTEAIREKYELIPYLNSSLFDISGLEDDTLRINSLDDGIKLNIFKSTVLKDNSKKKTGELPTLQYLFEFLNAYDFASEGKEEIQEENKSLINASVLGLIFEKINGYKDGSFFTPGFITMYMCRETIHRAVVQKFNEAKGWNVELFEDLHNKIKSDEIAEANSIINSIKICDPAVGSGHFLVSALNEIISIKSELRILCDREGKLLRDYAVVVENDELMVSSGHEELFLYKPGNKESQRVQEALFHEKQTIIENCLFGVDINPNSVKICRLRLWIELLKNAYYTADSKYAELETLPNIDINIKQGNSLISRFSLDADLSKALKSIKYGVNDYRAFVNSYKNATDKDQKRGFETLINQIKSDFRTEIDKNDPKVVRKNKLGGDLFNLLNQSKVFEPTEKEKKETEKKKEKLELEISKLAAEIKEIKDSAIYKDAFEWRFEFPEVLDHTGNFIGFDVVIGNPPYIRQEEFTAIKHYLESTYKVFSSSADLLVYFIERGISIIRDEANLTFIVANKFLRAGYGKSLRDYLNKLQIRQLIDFGDLPVFAEATTYPCILSIAKKPGNEPLRALQMDQLHAHNLREHINRHSFELSLTRLHPDGWSLTNNEVANIHDKLKSSGIPLSEYVNNHVYYGIKTGLNKAFVIDEDKLRSITSETKPYTDVIKPFLEGKNVKKYETPVSNKHLILFKNGQTKEMFGRLQENDAFNMLKTKYPAIVSHLLNFRDDAKKRSDQGDYWWELRPCDYYDKFEIPKIIFPNICKQPEFTFDTNGIFTNQKCFIIPLDDKYLLGVLNSSVTFFLFRHTLPKLRGDFYEPSYVYLKDFPIPKANDNIRSKITSLVDEILMIKRGDSGRDITDLELEIDKIIYELYKLTAEEIQIIKTHH